MAICWWQQAEVVGAVYWFCSSKETLPFFSSFGLRLGHGNGWAKLLAIKRAHQAITFQIERTQVSGWLYIAMLPATYNLLTPSHHHPPAQTLIWRKKKSSIVFKYFYQFVRVPGEGNGNPLWYSCLENPRDGGAWWAAVYGVAQTEAT